MGKSVANAATPVEAEPDPGAVAPDRGESLVRRAIPIALAGAVLLSYIAFALIPEHPGPPERAGSPMLAHWDGEWYLDIAQYGYRGGGESSETYRPEFFPLFPGLAAGVHAVLPFLSLDAAGVILNFFLTLAAVGLMVHVGASWPLAHRCLLAVFLVTIPNAFFFVCFFGEATLAFCTALVIWGIRTPDRLVVAGIGAALATMGRPVGVLLTVPVGLAVLFRKPKGWRDFVPAAVAAAGVPVLFAVYEVMAGSPIAFMRAQFANPDWREGVLGRHGIAGFYRTVHDALFGIGFEDLGAQPVGVVMVVWVVAFGLLAWRWDKAIAIGTLVMALGPLWFQAISALARYLVPTWTAWVGGFATLRHRRSGLVLVAVLVAAGYFLNLRFLERFTRWSFVG